MIVFLFAPLLLSIGAGINFWLGARARLEITPDVFLTTYLGAPDHRRALQALIDGHLAYLSRRRVHD